MSLHSAPTTKDSVRRYLLAAYDISEAEADRVLASPGATEAIRKGRVYGSFAGFVADQVAADHDWPERPDFDPDAGDDDEDEW